ncbi:MAG: helix-turn-helix transcriptional regulator [Balneolaceae bacterium]
MIRTEAEYNRSIERLEEENEIINAQRLHFIGLGYEGEELERLMQPSISFHEQLKEEVEAYERMKRGDLDQLHDFNNIGRWLIGLRIAFGLTQKEMAEKLGVSPAQVSRDETNDYHGITIERVQYILEKFGVKFTAEIENPIPPLKSNSENNNIVYA